MAGFEQKSRCNRCDRRFVPRVITEETEQGGERLYFDCPFCDTSYQVIEVTKKGLAARAALVGLRSAMKGLRKQPHTEDKRVRMLGLQDEYGAYQAMLERETVRPEV